MKNARAKLIDFATNSGCQKEKVNKLFWPLCAITNLFLFIITAVVNFAIVLLTIPFSIIYTPTEGFQKLGRRNDKGYFFDSYSRYLKYHRASVGTLIAIITVGAGIIINAFLAFHPIVTKAGGGPSGPCTEPLGVYINSPSSTQTIDEGSTFTLSGHWCATYLDDGGLCTICAYNKTYTGQFRLSGGSWFSINSTSALKVASGTYTGSASSQGDLDPLAGCSCSTNPANYTQTITANTGSEGKIYEVRFSVDNDPGEIAYSGAKTINVKPKAPTGFTHSANTTSSVTWGWTDNSANETGYYVKNAEGNNVSADLGAGASSWPETDLATNTPYTRHSNVYADSGNNDSHSASVYTAIETPTGINTESKTDTVITVSATGTISNLESGNSGLYFTETVTNTNSGWTPINTWQKTGLSPNTQYTFKVKARNGDQDETAETATVNIKTLSPAPNVTSSRNPQTWYKNASFTFSNSAGFGTGGVGYYRYAWNQSAIHTWTGLETIWNSSNLTVQTNNPGSWYLHVKSYNDEGVANGTYDYGPYYFDNTAPVIQNKMPNLENTVPSNTPLEEEVDVDVSKEDGNTVADLSSIQIKAANPSGELLVDWTDAVINIQADTYIIDWSIPEAFFDQLDQGVNNISVQVTDEAGNTSTEENAFYIIKDTLAPAITNIDSAVSTNSATLTWQTDEPATTQLKWGADSSLAYSTTKIEDLTIDHTVTLTGLNESTTYYFSPVSQDSLNQEKIGSLYEFVTTSLPATTIFNVQVTNLTTTSAIITWITNHAATSKVRYGLTTAYGLEVSSDELTTNHSLTLTNLTANNTYHYEVMSQGNTYAYDADATFTTSPLAEEEIISQEITINDQELSDTSLTENEDRPLIRNQNIVLAGKTLPYAEVVISLGSDYSETTTADASGYWSVNFNEVALGQYTVTATITKNGTTSVITLGIFLVVHPAATIVYPTDNLSVIERKPIIKGLAKSGHKVKVYIDDIYNGYTTATTHASGTGSFAYTPFLNLTFGQHTLHTVTEDTAGHRSAVSETITFQVVYPFITPTILNNYIDATSSFITLTGLAKNGSTVYVYLNDQLYGTFTVTDHPSGTATFAYTLSTNDLSADHHKIYLVAADALGKLSKRSKIITFEKLEQKIINPVDDFTYTVQSGDNLWNIAREYYDDGKLFQSLIDKNKVNYPSLIDYPAIIQPGWRLRL